MNTAKTTVAHDHYLVTGSDLFRNLHNQLVHIIQYRRRYGAGGNWQAPDSDECRRCKAPHAQAYTKAYTQTYGVYESRNECARAALWLRGYE